MDYLGIKEEDLDSIEFVKAALINDDRVLVSKQGIFKVNGIYTIGGKRSGGYRTITIGKSKSYSSNRVIYATFSEETLSNNDVIDHINTNPFDNQFSNLRKTDNKGNMNNELTRLKQSKPISKYSLDGKLIKEYKSSEEITTELGKSVENLVRRCCINKRVTWGGFIWIYKGDEDTILKNKLEKVNSPNVLTQVVKDNNIKVFDKSGNLLKISNSRKDISDFLGITESRIGSLLFNKSLSIIKGSYIICYEGNEDIIQKTIDKYKNPFSDKENCRKEAMKYSSRTKFLLGSHSAYKQASLNGWLDEFFPLHVPKKVKQYDLSGNFIKKFSSYSSAEKELGIKNINRVCNGSGSVSGEFLWCYEGEEDRIPEKVEKIKKKK